MEIGVAKRVFGFTLGTPMGGYVTRKERLATHKLDEPALRAIALRNKQTLAVMVSADLLVITPEINQAVSDRVLPILPEGTVLFLHANHTHSSAGAFWNHRLARWFMGRYREAVFTRIVDTFSAAILEAVDDLQIGSAAVGTTRMPGMNENRRIAGADVDDRLTVARFDVEGKTKAALVAFAAHPVIAAEKDFHGMSGDYPAEICRMLEQDIPVVGFLQGAIGAVSPVWPDHIDDATEHIRFMAEPIVEKTRSILAGLKPLKSAKLQAGYEPIVKPPFGVDPFPKDWKWSPLLYYPAIKAWEALHTKKYADRTTSICGVRINDHVFVGFPADLGDLLSRTMSSDANKFDLTSTCLSHTGDFIGYVHRREDMDAHPPKESRGMFIYENFMNFHGKDTGDALMQANEKLLAQFV